MTMDQPSITYSWHTGTRIVFRFLFLYFAFYLFPFPLSYFLPSENSIHVLLWNTVVTWVGSNVLHLYEAITILPNGSGDTTWNYVHVFCGLSLAIFGSLIWSIFDRGAKNYLKLYHWLIVALRYYVGFQLLDYGLIKIFHVQFLSPDGERLWQTYGNSSPMGLLWTFMGYSKPYNIFAGGIEFIGGALLLFRRTTLLGALVSFAVMSNVAMLNFAYDVPVKLFSLHLLTMIAIILVPDARRLYNFFIVHKSTTAEPYQLQLPRRWRIASMVVKGIVITTVASGFLYSTFNYYLITYPERNDGLEGVYEVNKHIINQDTMINDGNNTRGWKRISVSWNGYEKREVVDVLYMDDARISWRIKADTLKRTVNIFSPDSTTVYLFDYVREGDRYSMTGTMDETSVSVDMQKMHYPLMERGFHWINEFPFNR